MRREETAQTVSATSPASANTVVHGTQFKGSLFSRADLLLIDASFLSVTGGPLDVYLQRKIANDSWLDWIHFPQVAAGASKRFTAVVDGRGGSIVDVGGGSDAAPGVGLAANTVVNCLPGGDVRIVFVAGPSTSAGATCSITITPFTDRV